MVLGTVPVGATTPGLLVSSLTASGLVSAKATFGGLSVNDPVALPPGLAPPPPPPDLPFSLQAEAIEAKVYIADTAVHFGAGNHAPNTEVKEYRFTNATVEDTDLRSGYWVSVFPLEGRPAPQWEETNSCVSAKASTETSTQVTGNAGAPVYTADINGAVAWLPVCDALAARHVRGDFLVTLWQLDTLVRAEEGTESLQSGVASKLSEQAPGYPLVTVSTDRQVVLTVRNGSLRLPDLASRDVRIYLFEPQIHSIGNLVLRDVSGFIAAQGKEINAPEHTLPGDLTATTARAPDTSMIPLDVEGTIVANGLATTISSPSVSLAWLWLLSIPALAALPMWLVWRRQQLLPQVATPQSHARALDLFSHAETFAFEGSFRKARRLLDKAIRMEGIAPDFFALRARCLAMLGDTRAAMRDHLQAHEAFPGSDPDAKASNAYEAARTCNQAGLRDEALSWLHLAAQYDPFILEDARDDPVLLSLFTSISGRPRRAER